MSVSVGLVGLGYWGPNLARNLLRSPNAELRWLCDLSTDLHDKHRASFPDVKFTTDLEDLLADDSLDAIVIASPVPPVARRRARPRSPARTGRGTRCRRHASAAARGS